MLSSELLEMIALAERLAAQGEPAVLSTLFDRSGPSYRDLGSMMVSGPASMIAGGVSGGCLEAYIARRGRELTRECDAKLLSFNTEPDESDSDKPVLGCGGSIDILVERLTPDHLSFLREMYDASLADTPHSIACVIDTSNHPSIEVRRTWLSGDGTDVPFEARSNPVLLQRIAPMTRFVLFGAGDDARPVAALAHSLGWHVTVADHRARLATKARFPDADVVLAGEWESLIESITFTPRTAVVLMTHDIADDLQILPLLTGKPAMYIGVLGPEQRRRWLLGILAETRELDETFAARIRGPIGLDLGDRTAPGIAVSVIAEVLAALNDRRALPLSEIAFRHSNTSPAEAIAANG